MKEMPYIEIFDSTLREGAQTPFVVFQPHEKTRILSALLEAGVDFAEVGYPASSTEELKEIQKLSSLTDRPALSVLGRCSIADIEVGSAAGAEVIDIDLGISPQQLDYLGLSLNEALEKAAVSVEFARSCRKRVKFAALDFPRTQIKDLVGLYKIVSKSGAEWFTLCDTVGISNPDEVTNVTKSLKKENGCKLAVHFHNDFDLATANSIAAAVAGAEQIEVTINGLGDRAGIAPMAPVVTYLKEFLGFKIGVDLTKLVGLSALISEIANIAVSPIEPIVGNYCFKHSPGIHVAGVIKDPSTFEPIDPSTFQLERSFAIGQYTGKRAIKHVLEQMSISVSENQLRSITHEVKAMARSGKKVETTDIRRLAQKESSSGYL